MRNLRTAAIFLLSLALIVSGAFLPRMMASWQDRGGGQLGYAPIGEVALEFDQGRDQGMGIRAKLALLQGGRDKLDIPASMASKSEQQLLALVQDTVTAYQQAGLIPVLSEPLAKQRIFPTASMVRWRPADTQGAVFWFIHVILDASNSRVMELIIDDETGTVCSIDYLEYEEPHLEATPYQLEAQMERLCAAYLKGLGSEFSQEDPEALAEAGFFQDGARFAKLSWGDILYGEISLSFCVSSTHFSVNPA